MSSDINEARRNFSEERGATYLPVDGATNSGFAMKTRGMTPVNGLRHEPTENATGWYIWCGEEFSGEADFFMPICTDHLCRELPEISRLLGLPAGYRFLLADGYLDVWYDTSLIQR